MSGSSDSNHPEGGFCETEVQEFRIRGNSLHGGDRQNRHLGSSVRDGPIGRTKETSLLVGDLHS